VIQLVAHSFVSDVKAMCATASSTLFSMRLHFDFLAIENHELSQRD
jgi:hypothetical protein